MTAVPHAWLLGAADDQPADALREVALGLRSAPDAMMVLNAGDQPRVAIYAADTAVTPDGHDTVVEVPALQGFMLVLLERRQAMADTAEMVRAHPRTHLSVHRNGVVAEALVLVEDSGWRWRGGAGEHLIRDPGTLTAVLTAAVGPVPAMMARTA